MLKPQTILICLILGLCPLLEKGYAKSPVDVCRKGVASVVRLFSMSARERETLTQNIMGKLKTTLLGEEIRGLPEELAQRMDEVFYRQVGKRMASLNLAQLRKVEEIMMRDRAFPDAGLPVHAAITFVKSSNSHDALVFNPNLPRHHPHRRIILIHELEHVIDLGLGRDVNKNKILMLRGETNAVIAEYQYINMVFDIQDLKGFKEDFPVLPLDLIEKAEDFYRFPQHTNNGVFVEGLSIKEAVAGYINTAFVTRVRTALTLKQDTYVEALLETHRSIL